MRLSEIESRLDAIKEELRGDLTKEQIEELETEIDSLVAERKAILNEMEKRRDLLDKVGREGRVIPSITPPAPQRSTSDVVNSRQYIDAFARYLVSQDDTEVRSLLTENASGGMVPVPELVYEVIKTAWEKDTLMSHVKPTDLKGNVKVGFEISATDAEVHEEGSEAVPEEVITLGIVRMEPKDIIKWITVSREALAMNGEALIRYIYSELTYKIVKKLSSLLIQDIIASPATASSTAPGVPTLAIAPAEDTIVQLMALLSGEATDCYIIMNRATRPSLESVALRAKYNIDVYDGLKERVLYTDALPSYAAAEAGQTYLIVGDLFEGAQVNVPENRDVDIIFDRNSLAEKGLVKIVGTMIAGHGVVADRAFAKATKPSA